MASSEDNKNAPEEGITTSPTSSPKPPSPAAGAAAQIAVIGCGWWAQGWHLPHLSLSSGVRIAAIVDPDPAPRSTLAATPLLPLADLSAKYGCPCFASLDDLLADPLGPALDGAVVASSHAAHFVAGAALLDEGARRRAAAGGAPHRVLHILMEKPMTTDVGEARRLWEASAKQYPEGAFIVNHTASYRPQTRVARQIVASHQLGKIRHIAASMNGPLMWLFDDPVNHSWVSKTPWKTGGEAAVTEKDKTPAAGEKEPMNGNGLAWGQIAHVLAWIYAVLGAGDGNASIDDQIARPISVYCTMSHAPNTGADVSLAAVITCHDGVTFSLSGTALLPGSQYTDQPVGKLISVELFGEKGSLRYCGDDAIPASGRLELRRTAAGRAEDGRPEFPCAEGRDNLKDGFYFEDGEQEGQGPGSMVAFLDACRGVPGTRVNDALIGLRTVQIIDGMYHSSLSGRAEIIDDMILPTKVA